MDKSEIKTRIEEGYKYLSEPFVVNLSIDQHIYNQADILIIDCMIRKLGLQGLFISLNKPCETIRKELKQNNLQADKIYFIDGASKETGNFLDSDKCFCLEDPSSLIELSLLTKTLCEEKKIKYIILDSLSTLLLYNDTKAVEKFVHSLVNKARKTNVSVVLLSPKEKSKEDILAEITQFCDKEIEL